jgi:hypothetical protein
MSSLVRGPVYLLSRLAVYDVEDRESLLLCRHKPPSHTSTSNDSSYTDCIVHVGCGNRLDGGEEKHHADESDPSDCDSVDIWPPSSESVGTGYERHTMLVDASTEDDGNVAEVQRRCRNAEDRNDGLARAQSNEIEASTEGDNEPDSVDWSLSD